MRQAAAASSEFRKSALAQLADERSAMHHPVDVT
jgi:hypothetical protein